MAKKQRTVRQEKRTAARQDSRRPEPKRPYTLQDCMKLGRLGNILFIVFIIICLIYYYSLAKHGTYVIPFEIVAYVVETGGFAFFALSVIWMDRLVRARAVMKVLMLVYIAAEVLLMLLEFQLLPFIPYDGLSHLLIYLHAIFSAGVGFSLLSLEPQNKRVQIAVIITCSIMLTGLFIAAAGYRVYASVLINAFAYVFFYSFMLRQLALEEVSIDCYGDQAQVTSFDSTMFADTPTLVEKPQREKPLTLRERAKRAAEQLTADEHTVLTDTQEKFEYEFGVQDDDDDEDDDAGDDA